MSEKHILHWADEAAGKTVAAVGESTRFIAIRFTDGTAMIFQADCDCGECSLSQRSSAPPDCQEWRDLANGVGLLSDAEYQALQDAEAELVKLLKRRQYEELRKEFESEKATGGL